MGYVQRQHRWPRYNNEARAKEKRGENILFLFFLLFYDSDYVFVGRGGGGGSISSTGSLIQRFLTNPPICEETYCNVLSSALFLQSSPRGGFSPCEFIPRFDPVFTRDDLEVRLVLPRRLQEVRRHDAGLRHHAALREPQPRRLGVGVLLQRDATAVKKLEVKVFTTV